MTNFIISTIGNFLYAISGLETNIDFKNLTYIFKKFSIFSQVLLKTQTYEEKPQTRKINFGMKHSRIPMLKKFFDKICLKISIFSKVLDKYEILNLPSLVKSPSRCLNSRKFSARPSVWFFFRIKLNIVFFSLKLLPFL